MTTTITDLITALAGPVFMFIGGLIAWFLKTRKEELQAIEERALERRIEIYNTILHPIMVMFAKKSTKEEKEKALIETGTVAYRKTSFNLITFGSDDLVNSYNDLMQSFYKDEANSDPKENIRKFANFLLSIRKDIYNKNTKLKDWDMLKFMITDIEKLK